MDVTQEIPVIVPEWDALDEMIARGPVTWGGRIVFDEPLTIAYWEEVTC